MEKKQHLLKLELHLANQSLHRGVAETNADTGVYTHFLILHYPPSASSDFSCFIAGPSQWRPCMPLMLLLLLLVLAVHHPAAHWHKAD